jgi:putative spermidine/putrescine transport system ATP-binding protein
LANLTKHYGEVVAVAGIDLEIEQGEFFTMLGPSGSGKTTTLRMIAGFEDPTSGTIELAGEDVRGVPPYDRAVNTVFQDYALFPHMTVGENVAYGMRVGGVSKAERARRRDEALEMVRLPDYGGRRPAELSGGQRQRVAVARALINDPSILLADEPTGNLDSQTGAEIMALFAELNARGNTIVLVTHEEDIAAHARRIVRLKDGKIRDDQPSDHAASPLRAGVPASA